MIIELNWPNAAPKPVLFVDAPTHPEKTDVVFVSSEGQREPSVSGGFASVI